MFVKLKEISTFRFYSCEEGRGRGRIQNLLLISMQDHILLQEKLRFFSSFRTGITGSVNLNIIGTVNTAVYISTGGEEEFGCGGALMYIGDEFRVSVSSCLPILQQLPGKHT